MKVGLIALVALVAMIGPAFAEDAKLGEYSFPFGIKPANVVYDSLDPVQDDDLLAYYVSLDSVKYSSADPISPTGQQNNEDWNIVITTTKNQWESAATLNSWDKETYITRTHFKNIL